MARQLRACSAGPSSGTRVGCSGSSSTRGASLRRRVGVVVTGSPFAGVLWWCGAAGGALGGLLVSAVQPPLVLRFHGMHVEPGLDCQLDHVLAFGLGLLVEDRPRL